MLIALQDQILWLRGFRTPDGEQKISSDAAFLLSKILQSQLRLQIDSHSASSSQTPSPGTHESELVRTNAIEAAGHLAEHEGNRYKLATAGIIAPLVGLLKVITDQRQMYATLRALHFLAMDQSNHRQLLKADAVEPLLRLCYSDTKALQVLAAATVAELALDKANWPQLMKGGLVAALVHLLQSNSQRAQIAAMVSIMKLSTNDANKILLGEAGAIPLIVPLLSPGPEDPQPIAALVLQNLAVPQANRHRIAEAGAFPLLVTLLKTGDPTAQEGAAGALMNLLDDTSLHESLIAADGVSALEAALKLQIENVQSYAAGAFMNLSTHGPSAVHVIEVSKYLMVASTQSPFPDTRKWAAAAVWNLIKGEMIPIIFGTVPMRSASFTQQRSGTLDAITPDFDKMGKAMGGWM